MSKPIRYVILLIVFIQLALVIGSLALPPLVRALTGLSFPDRSVEPRKGGRFA